MRIMTFLVAFLMSAFQLFSQNLIYKGSTPYPATSTWEFATNSGSPFQLLVTVAKAKEGGYLLLVADVPDTEIFTISGTVSLFLNGGKLITLTQKVASDALDGSSQALYAISKANYELLKGTDINKIRFSILNRWMKTKQSFSATNSRIPVEITDQQTYATAEEIAALEN